MARRRVMFREIERAVVESTGVPVALIRTPRKGRYRRGEQLRAGAAKRVVVLLARRLRPDFSLPFVAARLGYQDHTGVLYQERRAEDLFKSDPSERARVEAALAALGCDGLPERDPRRADNHELRMEMLRSPR